MMLRFKKTAFPIWRLPGIGPCELVVEGREANMSKKRDRFGFPSRWYVLVSSI